VLVYPHLTLLLPSRVFALPFSFLASTGQAFYLRLELVHLDIEGVDAVVEPLHLFGFLSLRRVQPRRGGQPLFAVSLGLGLAFHYLEPLHLRFYKFPIFHQRGLVLDFSAGQPCFNLVSQPLKLLNFLFQVLLVLLLLVAVRGVVNLLPGLLKLFYSLRHLL